MKVKKLQLNIDDEVWLKNPDLRSLMTILNQDSGHARIVGGAVRDALLNIFRKQKRKIGDIDIASTLSPQENISLLEKAGITVVPTGIKHGTITVIINKKPFEITTLRRDISTDGRHAEVEYTKGWNEDAKRRDFTINALYLDIDGSIYDPLDGLKDIKSAKVRFIGNANKRIEEDALRILRFFRFSSEIEVGAIDEQGMLACVELKEMINGLSGERINQELKKTLLSKRASQIIPLLATIGLLRVILPEYDGYDNYKKYVKREKKHKLKDFMGRLSSLLPRNEKIIIQVSKRLKLSNKQRDQLTAFSREYKSHDLRMKTLRRVIYQYGRKTVIHNLLRLGTLDEKALNYINDYVVPELPVSGKDLIKQGWSEGTEMGAELKRIEQQWINSDFTV
ncbi:MAG: CCA tRNA nucleotidyltransferase [Emcibacteraceae bacterium]|nr:CCA tRNA nucleotidyltransferase [Emcibacteraceae bacterium]